MKSIHPYVLLPKCLFVMSVITTCTTKATPSSPLSNPMSIPEVKKILLPHTLSQRQSNMNDNDDNESRRRPSKRVHPSDASMKDENDYNDEDYYHNDLNYILQENSKEEIQHTLPSSITSSSSYSSFQSLLLSPQKKYTSFLHPTKNTHHSSSLSTPKTTQLRKTGTTIVGLTANHGQTLILAADTRATEGTVVADKRCEKVHVLASNVWCCGAGTSGDIDALVRLTKYTFWLRGKIGESVGNIHEEEDKVREEEEEGLKRVSKDSLPPPASVSAISRFLQDKLYQGKGSIGANLVLGGYEHSPSSSSPFSTTPKGAILMAIHPHGSIDIIPYTALGSGGLAAMSILESRYHANLTEEEGVELVKDAVRSGIENDMGSGSQIDLCIMDANGVRYQRAVVQEEELEKKVEDDRMEEMLSRRHLRIDEEEEEEGGEEGGSEGEKEMLMIGGVNGFGSLPYSIKSKRLIMENEEVVEGQRREWLDDILD